MNKKRFILLGIISIFVMMGAIFYFVINKQSAPSEKEIYQVAADDDDGPEQIFEKAFLKYSNQHDTKVTDDERRIIAEYMVANYLKGKAYWVDAKGLRHELWIGTGDIITMSKNTSTFTITNAISDYQKKTVTINFGFEKALIELDKLRRSAQP